jgi:hypothetical protein
MGYLQEAEPFFAARVPAPALPSNIQSTHFTFPVFSPTRAVFSPEQPRYRKCRQPEFLRLLFVGFQTSIFVGKKFKSQ